MKEKIKSKREGRIIFLRKSKAIILTKELELFNTFSKIIITLTKNNKIIIEQED